MKTTMLDLYAVDPSYLPEGEFYGINQLSDFEFSSWKQITQAVNTQGHPLERWSQWILSHRNKLKVFNPRFSSLRISIDASPPIVEIVIKKEFALICVLGPSVALMALSAWLLCF